jgi:hypothetical protein
MIKILKFPYPWHDSTHDNMFKHFREPKGLKKMEQGARGKGHGALNRRAR